MPAIAIDSLDKPLLLGEGTRALLLKALTSGATVGLTDATAGSSLAGPSVTADDEINPEPCGQSNYQYTNNAYSGRYTNHAAQQGGQTETEMAFMYHVYYCNNWNAWNYYIKPWVREAGEDGQQDDYVNGYLINDSGYYIWNPEFDRCCHPEGHWDGRYTTTGQVSAANYGYPHDWWAWDKVTWEEFSDGYDHTGAYSTRVGDLGWPCCSYGWWNGSTWHTD